jgi:IS30 family transposase
MITEQQSEMIDYIIAGNNKSDIAKLLNVSRQTVYAWIDLPEVKTEKQKRLNDIKKDAKNKIATKVDNCIDVIYDIAIKSKDMRTKFAAAKYLCDQFIGAPATEKPANDNTNKDIEVKLVDDIDEVVAKIKKDNNIDKFDFEK